MKKKSFFFIALCLSMAAQSQIQKGTGFLSGAISGNYTKNQGRGALSTRNDNTSAWSLLISYGDYVSENVAIGVGVGFNANNYKGTSYYNDPFGYSSYITNQQGMLYYLSPFVRISKSISEKLYCFGAFNALAGMGPGKDTYDDIGTGASSHTYKTKQTMLGGGITGGLNYFLNRHFALQLSYGNISYSYTKFVRDNGPYNDDFTSTLDGINVNLGLSSIGVGLQYYINCAKEKK